MTKKIYDMFLKYFSDRNLNIKVDLQFIYLCSNHFCAFEYIELHECHKCLCLSENSIVFSIWI